MKQTAGPGGYLRYWNKELHLYLGLFLSPFVLLYCISTILLNHNWKLWSGGTETQTRQIAVRLDSTGGADNLQLAKQAMQQAGVAGEVLYINRQKNRLDFPVVRPRETVNFEVDLERGTARIESRGQAFWDALIYLHKSPGPHVAAIRGNWVFTVAWKILANAAACLLIFMTAGGVYLWALVKSERKTGLDALGAGCLVVLLTVFFLLY